MKTHTDLKELLEDFADLCQERMWEDHDKDLKEFVDEFLSSNSLALGKPEPLAKNKQTKQFCTFYNSECIKEFCSVTPYWHKCKHLVAK